MIPGSGKPKGSLGVTARSEVRVGESTPASTITACAPWKHVDTPYWKLMLPVYGLLVCAVGWAVWAADGPSMMGLNRWSVFLVLPLLIPFRTVGRRTWSDSDVSPAVPAEDK